MLGWGSVAGRNKTIDFPASMPDLDHWLVATDNHRPPPACNPALTFDCGGQIFGLEDLAPELVRRPGAILYPRSTFKGERNRRKMDNGCPRFAPRLDADHLGIAVIHDHHRAGKQRVVHRG